MSKSIGNDTQLVNLGITREQIEQRANRDHTRFTEEQAKIDATEPAESEPGLQYPEPDPPLPLS